jgi:pimeloyl-ACP methyl ester carboxylesterase
MARAILVHGAGGGGWEWDLWVDAVTEAGLSDQLELVALTLEPPTGRDLEATQLDDYIDQIVEAAGKDACSKKLILVGASMGGTLIAKAAERLPRVDFLVFVCTTTPSLVEIATLEEAPPKYGPRVKWAGGPLQDTIDAVPDASPEVQRWAAALWRDESGAVLNEIDGGRVTCNVEILRSIPSLVVIPMKDTAIPPERQQAFASAIGANRIIFLEGASHCGPLLSCVDAKKTALDVFKWAFSK